MMAGSIIAIIIDYVARSYKVGASTPSGILADFTAGDMMQLTAYGFLTFVALATNRRDFANFSYGMMSGKMIPSLIFPKLGIGRYGLFDIDETGKLVPAFSNPLPS